MTHTTVFSKGSQSLQAAGKSHGKPADFFGPSPTRIKRRRKSTYLKATVLRHIHPSPHTNTNMKMHMKNEK